MLSEMNSYPEQRAFIIEINNTDDALDRVYNLVLSLSATKSDKFKYLTYKSLIPFSLMNQIQVRKPPIFNLNEY